MNGSYSQPVVRASLATIPEHPRGDGSGTRPSRGKASYVLPWNIDLNGAVKYLKNVVNQTDVCLEEGNRTTKGEGGNGRLEEGNRDFKMFLEEEFRASRTNVDPKGRSDPWG